MHPDGRGDVAAAFGQNGLYYFSIDRPVTQISPYNAIAVSMDFYGNLVASFGPGGGPGGVYQYTLGDGWSQISTSIATLVAVDYKGDISLGFGPGGALYKKFVGAADFVVLSTGSPTVLA